MYQNYQAKEKVSSKRESIKREGIKTIIPVWVLRWALRWLDLVYTFLQPWYWHLWILLLLWLSPPFVAIVVVPLFPIVPTFEGALLLIERTTVCGDEQFTDDEELDTIVTMTSFDFFLWFIFAIIPGSGFFIFFTPWWEGEEEIDEDGEEAIEDGDEESDDRIGEEDGEGTGEEVILFGDEAWRHDLDEVEKLDEEDEDGDEGDDEEGDKDEEDGSDLGRRRCGGMRLVSSDSMGSILMDRGTRRLFLTSSFSSSSLLTTGWPLDWIIIIVDCWSSQVATVPDVEHLDEFEDEDDLSHEIVKFTLHEFTFEDENGLIRTFGSSFKNLSISRTSYGGKILKKIIISKKLGKISWKNSSKFRTFFEKKIERKEIGREGIVRKGKGAV